MIKCVAIDDEPLARECIVNYAAQIDFLEVVGQGQNPMDLINILEKQKVDLVFLDIQMPVMNGVDFLKSAQNLPMVIFTTAYPSYALEGYQLDVLDYLLKPITFNRYFQAATKAREYFNLQQASAEISSTQEERDYFFIKCNSKFEKIFLDEILFVQAMQNYVTIHTSDEKFMTLMNLKSVQQKLEGKGFIRIHKSFLIAKNKIQGLENHEIIIASHRIPISRNYRKEVLDQVIGDNLW